MSLVMIVVPAGALLSWKRGDLMGVLQRLWWCAALAVVIGLACFALISPHKVVACIGLAELIERTKAFRAPWAEVRRRLTGLPRGAWGMTFAHVGLGVFALGAAFESTWKLEAAQALAPGGQMALGSAYVVHLDKVGQVEGPNYIAERGVVRVLDPKGRLVCTGEPERRTFDDRQTTSEVALCFKPLSDIYLVIGERREAAEGGVTWLVRAYFNPWVRFLLLGPMLMAIGGFLSLSDRRLRMAAPQRRAAAPSTPPELSPAE
jgi:cytochrome c-type biogenesis protein CcmF